MQEKAVANEKPIYLKAKQEVAHVQAKLETAKKLHIAAKKMAESNVGNINQCEEQLRSAVFHICNCRELCNGHW